MTPRRAASWRNNESSSSGNLTVVRLMYASIPCCAAVALVLIAACGPAGPVTPRATFDVEGPLTGYGPCATPTEETVPIPAGMILPDDAIVTSQRIEDPITEVNGFIPLTPVQIRRYYEERADIGIISIEDEILEAEILVELDEYRTFVKATVICDTGSQFVAVGAANVAASAVPTPTGGDR